MVCAKKANHGYNQYFCSNLFLPYNRPAQSPIQEGKKRAKEENKDNGCLFFQSILLYTAKQWTALSWATKR